LADAVRAWLLLDASHRQSAALTTEHAVQLNGVATSHFSGETIAALAEKLTDR